MITGHVYSTLAGNLVADLSIPRATRGDELCSGGLIYSVEIGRCSQKPEFSDMSARQRVRASQASDSGELGIHNERVLFLVFESMKWDIHALCSTASVNRKLRAVVNRLLWREVCLYRAPRMIATLTNGAINSRIGGGWHTLAKLMFFCCGCEPTRHFRPSEPTRGHRVKASRFSKTSGQSFLSRNCRGDLLYVSDMCEHQTGDKEEDHLGIFRGVFRGFHRSRTRACLVERRVKLEERVMCPYCGAPVWSMTTARLVPKSAARRLGSHDGAVEYFVCVNGHLYGSCWLVPLSSDEDDSDGEEECYEDGHRRISYDDRTTTSGSLGSTGEEVVEY